MLKPIKSWGASIFTVLLNQYASVLTPLVAAQAAQKSRLSNQADICFRICFLLQKRAGASKLLPLNAATPSYDRPFIMAIIGMNIAITMKPTTKPRPTIIKGSMAAASCSSWVSISTS